MPPKASTEDFCPGSWNPNWQWIYEQWGHRCCPQSSFPQRMHKTGICYLNISPKGQPKRWNSVSGAFLGLPGTTPYSKQPFLHASCNKSYQYCKYSLTLHNVIQRPLPLYVNDNVILVTHLPSAPLGKASQCVCAVCTCVLWSESLCVPYHPPKILKLKPNLNVMVLKVIRS
jgi:hypothetical protein